MNQPLVTCRLIRCRDTDPCRWRISIIDGDLSLAEIYLWRRSVGDLSLTEICRWQRSIFDGDLSEIYLWRRSVGDLSLTEICQRSIFGGDLSEIYLWRRSVGDLSLTEICRWRRSNFDWDLSLAEIYLWWRSVIGGDLSLMEICRWRRSTFTEFNCSDARLLLRDHLRDRFSTFSGARSVADDTLCGWRCLLPGAIPAVVLAVVFSELIAVVVQLVERLQDGRQELFVEARPRRLRRLVECIAVRLLQ